MNFKILLAMVAMTAVFFSGCQSTEPVPDRVPLNYVSARLYDFMDIFEFNVGFDITCDNLYLVAAVEPLALGGGYYDSEKLGLDGRLFGRWHETRTEADFLFDCLIGYEKRPVRGNRYLFDGMYKSMTNYKHDDGQPFRAWGLTHRLFDQEHYPLDITAEIYIFFLGLDLGLSPVELLDFVAGIFTIDAISNDDYVNPMGWEPAQSDAEAESNTSEVAIILPGLTRSRWESTETFSVDDISTVPPRPGIMLTLENVPGTTVEPEPEKISHETNSQTAPAPPMYAPPQDELAQDEPIVVTLESVPKTKQDDDPKKKAEKPDPGMMVITLESVPSSEKTKKTVEQKPAKPETKPTKAPATVPAQPDKDQVEKPVTPDEEMMVVTLESVPSDQAETAKPAVTKPVKIRPRTLATPSRNPQPMVPPEMMDDYKAVFARTGFGKPDELFRLATWCADKGLERKTVWHLRQTIAIDPAHVEARRMLGYIRRGRVWVRSNPVDLTHTAPVE